MKNSLKRIISKIHTRFIRMRIKVYTKRLKRYESKVFKLDDKIATLRIYNKHIVTCMETNAMWDVDHDYEREKVLEVNKNAYLMDTYIISRDNLSSVVDNIQMKLSLLSRSIEESS